MSLPSEEGGDSDGGEQIVSAHGSKTVTKQITPITAAGSNEVIPGTVPENNPPRPSVNNQVVEGAAPPSKPPMTIVYLWLGCIAVMPLVAYSGSDTLFLANLLFVGPIFVTVLRRLEDPQQQMQGRWQAIAGMVLAILVDVFKIAIFSLVYLFVVLFAAGAITHPHEQERLIAPVDDRTICIHFHKEQTTQ
jgi:hypothetical protein